jgi:polar amino acid transport system substrate-binding protein
MPSRMRWMSAAVPVMCAVAVAGCGSSNSSSGGSTGGAGAAPTSTAAGSSGASGSSGSSGASGSSGSAGASGTSGASGSSGMSGSSGSSGASSGGAGAAAKLVPSSIKSKGTITIAADASYAPNEFFGSDGKTIIGMDADLTAALAKEMGLKAKLVNETFDGIIPGLASGKFDMGASSFTDTKEREQTVNFVDYFSAGESFFTKASGGVSITGLSGLCGKSVAVEKGTTEESDAQAQGKKCKVTVLSFPDQNAANLALSSGRAQLGFADSPVAAYAVKKSGGQFKLVGKALEAAPYGLAFPKNSTLDKATLVALKALIKNGTYMKILTKWGVQAGAITTPKLNGALS